MNNLIKKTICCLTLLTFLFSSFGPLPRAWAQAVSLPPPGEMVGVSAPSQPMVLRGVTVHPENPFLFDFIVDQGQSSDDIQAGSTRLIKYFLASLTIPEDDLWVNLSPYEKDRIIPDEFGQTGMGRDLLAQDYILKQLASTLLYPDSDVGKKFWAEVYRQAYEKFGTTDVPVDTFHKVWIMPDVAKVFERPAANGQLTAEGQPQGMAAFVVKARMKVMLEEDYDALRRSVESRDADAGSTAPKDMSTQVMREIVLPIIEREVNEGANFATVRQVYYSLVLAAWFKKQMKESLLGQKYVDHRQTSGVNIEDPNEKQAIYDRYVESLKKGVFNFIREDNDPLTNEAIPRKYFSGGWIGKMIFAQADAVEAAPIAAGMSDRAMVVRTELSPQPVTSDQVVALGVEPGALATRTAVMSPGTEWKLTSLPLEYYHALMDNLGVLYDLDPHLNAIEQRFHVLRRYRFAQDYYQRRQWVISANDFGSRLSLDYGKSISDLEIYLEAASRRLIDPNKVSSVLDLGVGTWSNAHVLPDAFPNAKHILGIEVKKTAREGFQEMVSHFQLDPQRYKFETGDFRTLPTSGILEKYSSAQGRFDLVLLQNPMVSLSAAEYRKLLRHVAGQMGEDGKLMVVFDRTRRNYDGNPELMDAIGQARGKAFDDFRISQQDGAKGRRTAVTVIVIPASELRVLPEEDPIVTQVSRQDNAMTNENGLSVMQSAVTLPGIIQVRPNYPKAISLPDEGAMFLAKEKDAQGVPFGRNILIQKVVEGAETLGRYRITVYGETTAGLRVRRGQTVSIPGLRLKAGENENGQLVLERDQNGLAPNDMGDTILAQEHFQPIAQGQRVRVELAVDQGKAVVYARLLANGRMLLSNNEDDQELIPGESSQTNLLGTNNLSVVFTNWSAKFIGVANDGRSKELQVKISRLQLTYDRINGYLQRLQERIDQKSPPKSDDGLAEQRKERFIELIRVALFGADSKADQKTVLDAVYKTDFKGIDLDPIWDYVRSGQVNPEERQRRYLAWDELAAAASFDAAMKQVPLENDVLAEARKTNAKAKVFKVDIAEFLDLGLLENKQQRRLLDKGVEALRSALRRRDVIRLDLGAIKRAEQSDRPLRDGTRYFFRINQAISVLAGVLAGYYAVNEQINDENAIFYTLRELLKNAFVHGNGLKSDRPIYFYFNASGNAFSIFDTHAQPAASEIGQVMPPALTSGGVGIKNAKSKGAHIIDRGVFGAHGYRAMVSFDDPFFRPGVLRRWGETSTADEAMTGQFAHRLARDPWSGNFTVDGMKLKQINEGGLNLIYEYPQEGLVFRILRRDKLPESKWPEVTQRIARLGELGLGPEVVDAGVIEGDPGNPYYIAVRRIEGYALNDIQEMSLEQEEYVQALMGRLLDNRIFIPDLKFSGLMIGRQAGHSEYQAWVVDGDFAIERPGMSRQELAREYLALIDQHVKMRVPGWDSVRAEPLRRFFQSATDHAMKTWSDAKRQALEKDAQKLQASLPAGVQLDVINAGQVPFGETVADENQPEPVPNTKAAPGEFDKDNNVVNFYLNNIDVRSGFLELLVEMIKLEKPMSPYQFKRKVEYLWNYLLKGKSWFSVGDLDTELFRNSLKGNKPSDILLRQKLGMTVDQLDTVTDQDLVRILNDVLKSKNLYLQVNIDAYKDRLDPRMRELLGLVESNGKSMISQEFMRLNRAILHAIYPEIPLRTVYVPLRLFGTEQLPKNVLLDQVMALYPQEYNDVLTDVKQGLLKNIYEKNILELVTLLKSGQEVSTKEYVKKVAELYQALMVPWGGYLFRYGNNSLMMNFANALLRIRPVVVAGRTYQLKGISHGGLDLQLTKSDFSDQFWAAVKEANPEVPLEPETAPDEAMRAGDGAVVKSLSKGLVFDPDNGKLRFGSEELKPASESVSRFKIFHYKDMALRIYTKEEGERFIENFRTFGRRGYNSPFIGSGDIQNTNGYMFIAVAWVDGKTLNSREAISDEEMDLVEGLIKSLALNNWSSEDPGAYQIMIGRVNQGPLRAYWIDPERMKRVRNVALALGSYEPVADDLPEGRRESMQQLLSGLLSENFDDTDPFFSVYYEKRAAGNADRAMGQSAPGGIDFNTNGVNLQVDSNGAPINVSDPTQWQNVQINGLYPIILNIAPAGNLSQLLGLAKS